jgi:hypothetical protein
VPWLLYQDLGEQLRAGDAAFWEPGWVVVGLIGVGAAAVIAAGDRVMSALGTWGASMTAVGAMAARGGGFDLGTEVFLAGLVLSGLGTAVVVGAGLEVASRRRAFSGLRRSASLAAGLAVTVVVVATLALAGPGRAGLPEDSLSGQFGFAVPAEGSAPTRVLLFGPPDSLPGSERTIDGLGYRLFVPPYPTSWEAHLGSERLGDRALANALQELVDGRTRRGGSALAEFGIGWVAFTEPSPLEAVFESQLDLVALRSLDFPVFRNEADAPIAAAADGSRWSPDGAGFTATSDSSGPVYVAVNADYRWGPGEWSQSDWANQIVTQGDAVGFAGHGPRRWAAIGALVWLVGLAVVVAMPWYTRRRS